MKVLAAAGDIGGARAIMPVLDSLSEASVPFAIMDHNYLGIHSPDSWQRISPVLEGKDNSLENEFKRGKYGVLLFSSSVKDTVALSAARVARRFNIPVIHLLDNWTNYRSRLSSNGLPVFYPEVYAVMDEYALREAAAEGIPEEILKITGQPALASLYNDFHIWSGTDKMAKREAAGFSSKKKLLVFISEPVESDQGDGPDSPQFRGYTEKTVLQQLCHHLQQHSDEIELGLLPHPRENAGELVETWEICRGRLDGGIARVQSGREAILMSDGISGMASILLYEAWLIHKPVISLQPGIRQSYLWFMSKRKGCYFLAEPAQWKEKITEWLAYVHKAPQKPAIRPELDVHRKAPENITRIVKQLLGNC